MDHRANRRTAMRRLLLLTTLLPVSAMADTIDATSRIAAVTIYPYGAAVTRVIDGALPAGSHTLRLTDLPAELAWNPDALRVTGSDGVVIGGTAVTEDPTLARPPTAAQVAARTRVDAARTAVQAATLDVARVQARLDAAAARQAFLANLGGNADLGGATAQSLAEIAAMVEAGVLEAGEAAVEAQAAMIAAEASLAEAQAALAQAEANPDAAPPATGGVVAEIALTATEGASAITVTYLVGNAGWAPVYDLRLTQGDAPALTLDRGVSIAQATGEDWTGVALTLSTADPQAQTVPSQLYPDLRRIVSEEEARKRTPAPMAEADAGFAAMEAEPVVMAAPAPTVVMQGDTVTYVYDGAADVPSGVTNLRLSLETISLTPELQARAVPRHDQTAFLMAEITNGGDEVLLPGQATLYRDGAMIGATDLPRLEPGQDTDVAFGAIDGLRLTRDMPVRAEGDRGILTTSRQIEEVAVLQVENLTGRAWDVRVLDQVPYSEQEDLSVTYSADIPVSETDVDGQRGILAWDITVAPGAEAAVTLTTTLSWPDGQVLQ
jgi:uncharacterized protein (TIGR02231 family)